MKQHDFPPEFRDSIPTIAVDFDGVLHNDDLGFHDGSCYGQPLPGALSGIRALSTQFNVVVFSAKAREDRPLHEGKTGRELIWEWLGLHGFDGLISDVTAEKPRAALYVDDNGYRFENWPTTMEFIRGKLS